MANELIEIKSNWLELADKFEKLPMPFEHDVFLQECHVAGTMHVDDILIKTKDVGIGTMLTFKREPANRYDEFAIAVETSTGTRLGYIPQRYNQVFARLMDAGKLLVAKVCHKSIDDEWLNLRIKIYLKDV